VSPLSPGLAVFDVSAFRLCCLVRAERRITTPAVVRKVGTSNLVPRFALPRVQQAASRSSTPFGNGMYI
jgi:hypothetical protein